MAVIESNGSHGHHKFILTVNEDSTSIANNTSNISYSFVLTYIDKYYGWSGWGQKISYSIYIAGETYSGYIPTYDGTTANVVLSSGTLPAILHNTNGTKEINMSFSVVDTANGYGSYGYYTCGNASATGIMTLTTIPRYAEILTAPNFNDEENPTITYSNPLGDLAESLDVCIANTTGSIIYVPYKPAKKTGSSFTFWLTDAERVTLRKAATTEKLDIRFYIKTVYSGVTNLESLSRELTIINAKPTLAPTAKDTLSKTLQLTGNENTVVKGWNTIAYAFNATAYKEATIVRYSLECGSQKANNASGTLNNVDSNIFKFTIEDSRGNILSRNVTLNLVNYINPTCNQTADIELVGETGAKINLTVSGNYFNNSFGAKSNQIGLGYRIKADSGSYGNWININTTPTFSGNTYSVKTAITGLNYETTYTIQCRISDLIVVVESAEYPINLTPVFDWSKTDFNFYVPVTIQGGRCYGEHILYNGNSADTIGLTDTLSNYDYIEVYYTDNNGMNGGYYKLYNPNGKDAVLSIIEASGTSSTYIRRTTYRFNEKIVSPYPAYAGYVLLSGATVTHSTGTNYIRITRIVGYK